MDVTNEEYTAVNLIPGANYAFQVAAVNNFGMGPFSKPLIITTLGLSKSYFRVCFSVDMFIY